MATPLFDICNVEPQIKWICNPRNNARYYYICPWQLRIKFMTKKVFISSHAACVNIWFWSEGYHGEEIRTKSFYDTKVNYIDNNPLRAGLVEKEEEYIWSSCGDFFGTRKGELVLTEF